MSAIYDLCAEVAAYGTHSADYAEKMLHRIPVTKVVDRIEYLVTVAKGRVILDLGASGPVVEILQREAAEYHAADIAPNGNLRNYHQIDFDLTDRLPAIPDLDVVIAGEIIEHLSNAGHFLDLVHRLGVEVVLTTPNAFTTVGQQYLAKGIESVNRDHVAWYSYHTLKVLIERHQFKLLKWFWYNGKPLVAEGLIFHMEPING